MLSEIKEESGASIIEKKLIKHIEVSHDDGITIQVELNKDFRKLKQLIQDKLQPLNTKITVKMAPQDQKTQPTQKLPGLQKVKNIVAVSSCKGGVGKSTVSVNLAYSLAQMEKKVGIFDADIYGPSLPTLVKTAKNELLQDEAGGIQALQFSGVKLMSYGYASQDRAAIMRGPIVSGLIQQLVGQTNWGELDYLIVDFPPGTGDIQLTLCQELDFKGAVIVTTPQKLSYVDVMKGIEMFENLKVPTICVVENMSFYRVGKEVHRIFGAGFTSQLQQNFGIKSAFKIPIDPEISQMSDSGTPFVLTMPETCESVGIFAKVAKSVVEELVMLQKPKPTLLYDAVTGLIEVKLPNKEGVEEVVKRVKSYDLRTACRCAACYDEMTGVQIMQPAKIPQDVFPRKLQKKGNYAVAVVWSDGHNSSLYPFDQIMKMPGL